MASSLASLRPPRTGWGMMVSLGPSSTPPCRMMAQMERRKCWFSPMRPVTPFMIMPTEWMVFSLMAVFGSRCRFLGGLFGALRAGSGGEPGNIDAGAGERAVEFLAPVGNVAGGSIAVEHAQRAVADVGQLVEDQVRDVDGLPGVEGHAFFAEAHFAGAFDDEVNFFLLLVVPRHLPPVGLQGDVADGKIGGLDGAHAPDQVLSAAPRGISASCNLSKIGNGHDGGSLSTPLYRHAYSEAIAP